jgi:hypothetical protein
MKFLAVCRLCDGWHWCGRPCLNNPVRLASGVAFNDPYPLPPKIVAVDKTADKGSSVDKGVDKRVDTAVSVDGVVDKAEARRQAQREWVRKKRAEEKHV